MSAHKIRLTIIEFCKLQIVKINPHIILRAADEAAGSYAMLFSSSVASSLFLCFAAKTIIYRIIMSLKALLLFTLRFPR